MHTLSLLNSVENSTVPRIEKRFLLRRDPSSGDLKTVPPITSYLAPSSSFYPDLALMVLSVLSFFFFIPSVTDSFSHLDL